MKAIVTINNKEVIVKVNVYHESCDRFADVTIGSKDFRYDFKVEANGGDDCHGYVFKAEDLINFLSNDIFI